MLSKALSCLNILQENRKIVNCRTWARNGSKYFTSWDRHDSNVANRLWQMQTRQELLSIKTSIINNCYNCILLFKEHHQQPNFRNVIAEQLNCLLVLYVLFLHDGFNLATTQSLVMEAWIHLNHQKLQSQLASHSPGLARAWHTQSN